MSKYVTVGYEVIGARHLAWEVYFVNTVRAKYIAELLFSLAFGMFKENINTSSSTRWTL